MRNRPDDGLDHRLALAQDIPIPEPQNAKFPFFEEFSPGMII
jgi:hypothetical protein